MMVHSNPVLPRRLLALRRLSGAAAVFLVACSTTPSTPGGSNSTAQLLVNPVTDQVGASLVDDGNVAIQSGKAIDDPGRLLLPPIAGEGSEWEASMVTSAVLTHSNARLRPFYPDRPLRSVPEVQAWLRDGKSDASAWVVLAQGRRQVEVTLAIVTAGRVWRSAPELVSVPIDERWTWPAQPPGDQPAHVLELPDAQLMYVLQNELWIENRDGRQRVEFNRGKFELRESRRWDELGVSWTERYRLRPANISRGAALLRRDVFFQIAGSDLPPGEGDIPRWWMGRRGAIAPLGLQRQMANWYVAFTSSPATWNLQDGWVLMRRGEGGRAWIQVFQARMRKVDASSDVQAPATTSPTIVVSAAGFDEYLGQAWADWVRAHTNVRVARWTASGPVAASGVTWAMEGGGSRWSIRPPKLSGLSLKEWERAVRSNWLTSPATGFRSVFAGAKLQRKSGELIFEFAQPVPDLGARMCHPALSLRDSILAPRLATHAVKPGASSNQGVELTPLQPVYSSIELKIEGNDENRRNAFLLGNTHMVRPMGWSDPDLALPIPTGGPAATTSQPTFHRATGGPFAQVVIVLGGALGSPSLKSQAAALAQLTPRQLLAVDDAKLTPTSPVTGRPMTEVSGPTGGAHSGGLRLHHSVTADQQRAAERVQALLGADGLAVDLATPARSDLDQLGANDATLSMLVLFSQEPLLRAIELYELLGIDSADDNWRSAEQLPLGDAGRMKAAQAAEEELLGSGRLVVMWNEPAQAYAWRQLADDESSGSGPAPFLFEARLYSSQDLLSLISP